MKKKKRAQRGLKKTRPMGCPLTRNRTSWCFRLCVPDAKGLGRCGRIAPHTLKSWTQLSIARHNKKRLEVHARKLERMYLAAACNRHYRPGIKIAEGSAEIAMPVRDAFRHSAGFVCDSVCLKAMGDAALFAVNSIVEDVHVLTVNFNAYLTHAAADGDITARGRFMSTCGEHYLAESVLTDSQGKEIGRGHGVLMKSEFPLSSKGGYR